MSAWLAVLQYGLVATLLLGLGVVLAHLVFSV